jgi:SAM (Sterile alpha motif) domain-containing protein
MGDLRDWLRSNRLEQYADAFEANDIDLDVLPALSERDLEELGLSLGNRRRLMKAIVGRGTEQAPSKPVSRDGPGLGEAERRQVKVLFADMVGSTALSAKVDPELLGGLIRSDRCRNIISASPPKSCWPPAGPRMASRISTAPSPGSTNPASASICRRSIACAGSACWRSVATTRMRRAPPSWPPATSQAARARSFSSAAPTRRFPNSAMVRAAESRSRGIVVL